MSRRVRKIQQQRARWKGHDPVSQGPLKPLRRTAPEPGTCQWAKAEALAQVDHCQHATAAAEHPERPWLTAPCDDHGVLTTAPVDYDNDRYPVDPGGYWVLCRRHANGVERTTPPEWWTDGE